MKQLNDEYVLEPEQIEWQLYTTDTVNTFD